MGVMVDWQATGTIVTAVVALVASIWQYFVVISGVRKDITDLATGVRKDITDLATNLRVEAVTANKSVMETLAIQGSKITRIETQTELFWNAVSTSISNLIKQPIHFKKDQLMDKLIPVNMPHLPESTIEELVELRLILKDELVMLQEVKDPKALAYALAIAYIDQTLYDKGLIKGECHEPVVYEPV